jgi:hypothetical protein
MLTLNVIDVSNGEHLALPFSLATGFGPMQVPGSGAGFTVEVRRKDRFQAGQPSTVPVRACCWWVEPPGISGDLSSADRPAVYSWRACAAGVKICLFGEFRRSTLN